MNDRVPCAKRRLLEGEFPRGRQVCCGQRPGEWPEVGLGEGGGLSGFHARYLGTCPPEGGGQASGIRQGTSEAWFVCSTMIALWLVREVVLEGHKTRASLVPLW